MDDLASLDPRTPRGVEIRGSAVALSDHEPPVPGLARQIIRISPHRIISWGLDGPRKSRKV
ncbi:hypothetical protein SMD20_08450 [Nonomuraea sp. LP-02]|uniref:hypothetical protein n=1 Tax=Nonomuraea sp. LP-02 TaxID=3097960 RepID=UPI002E330790|nr:hypothetical protein [Nonomuraea sp. LP-02]MED7924259.1 hypothetical protein [Nonomuraea sp. LP-02]